MGSRVKYAQRKVDNKTKTINLKSSCRQSPIENDKRKNETKKRKEKIPLARLDQSSSLSLPELIPEK